MSNFHKFVVTDTCAVWNVLSARLLHSTSVAVGCQFSLTDFCLYECLHKPRSNHTASDDELQSRLRTAQAAGQFQSFPLDVEDLQEIEVLRRRQNLSKGELASIAFAKKTRQAFLTDDQGARSLASTAIERKFVQTTPQLLGWLVFTGHIGDSDVPAIIAEHESMDRPLKKYFQNMYMEGLRCRMMNSTSLG